MKFIVKFVIIGLIILIFGQVFMGSFFQEQNTLSYDVETQMRTEQLFN